MPTLPEPCPSCGLPSDDPGGPCSACWAEDGPLADDEAPFGQLSLDDDPFYDTDPLFDDGDGF